MYIDTHCHITSLNVKDYIDNAKKEGVEKIICASENLENSIENSKLAKENTSLYACVGVHPQNVMDSYDIDKFKELIKERKVVGIGEIGLDYHMGKENREEQIYVFREFLNLAQEYNMPVVIHSRDALVDTINILKDYKVKGIIHCFSGSLETAKEYIRMGFFLGIGGVITFKNSKLGEVVKNIPLEYIVLETDSPFLAPHPYRGTVNESKNIHISIVRDITTRNATRIFDI